METILFMIIWIGGASLHTILELNLKKQCSAEPGKSGEKVSKPFVTGVNGK